MENVGTAAMGLVSFAALAFLLAVIGSLAGIQVLGTPPEAYSRACTNLALIAIALLLLRRNDAGPGV